ncbi:MAG: LexA family transcriptional regulator [Phycisphaerales bacterium]|jgi:transcriptional regulator with XRE-family HTH domain|nr:LexA family transcriptional regulator [Phycisphaerales bacterium]
MRKKLSEISQKEISARIAQVRLEVAGPRGKSRFAKLLGLSPSTYDYYESTRTPPADILIDIARIAKVDLHWLLTGRSGPDGAPIDHPILQRAAEMLDGKPDAAAPLAAFLELLESSLGFPSKQGEEAQLEPDPDPPRPAPAPRSQPADPRAAWIPVLGRSAAGIPRFWSDQDESAGVTTLDELIERNALNPDRQVRTATAATETDQAPVELITLNEPDSGDVVSFVAAPGVKAIYPNAFALRIDGESMQPDIRHGDLVILSPSVNASDGKAAVVQLDGQIGVTCKLFRRDGNTIHLVPINDELAPQTYPAASLSWALRVLARVRS